MSGNEEDRIYILLQNHYSERMVIGPVYKNHIQKIAVTVTLGSLAVFMVTVFLRNTNIELFALIATASVIVLSLATITYGISTIYENTKEAFPITPGYMSPMQKRIRTETELQDKLAEYSQSSIRNVKKRLEYEMEAQQARTEWVLGALSKLGVLPAAFAIYALYFRVLEEQLPHNMDMYAMAAVVGLSVGAAMAGTVMLNIRSMIFVLDSTIGNLRTTSPDHPARNV